MMMRRGLVLGCLCAGLVGGAAWAGPEPTEMDASALEAGVSLRVYDLGQALDALPELIDNQTGNVNRVVRTVDLGKGAFGLKDRFYAEVTGWLKVDRPGDYAFELFSDDGSELLVGGERLIAHDDRHSMASGASGEATLVAGWYALRLRMFEADGDEGLRLTWRPPGAEAFEVVPASALWTEADQVRVTSPGEKQFMVRGQTLRPGSGRPLDGVHPALSLTDLRPAGFEPLVGGMDFLPDGRLVLCTWDPSGDVFVLDGVLGETDAERVTATKFATGLAEPLGLKVVDGRVMVLQKQELTELVDHDGDGVADEYRAVAGGWPVSDNFHEFAFGLETDDRGWLVALLAVAIDPGGDTTVPQVEGRGRAIAIDPATGRTETIAAGFRTPNGVGNGVDGEMFVLDNQGGWVPVSKIVHLQRGGFYGSRLTPPNALEDEPVILPAVWLPQGEIGNSPTSPALIPESWGPYAGQMLHGDVTHGGVKRVFMERVSGVYQGAVFRFTQGLEAGVNRIVFGPDDALYVGGVGSSGNWQHAGKHWYGLQKLSFAGDAALPLEMLAVRPGRGGVEVEFTQPLDVAALEAGSFVLEHYTYEATAAYGGPKLDKHDLAVDGVTASPDGRRVWLSLSEETPLEPGYVIHVSVDVRGAGGEVPWTTEAWYTMQVLPDRVPDFVGAGAGAGAGLELEPGFAWLFDGTAASVDKHWRGWRREGVPELWQVRNGELVLVERGGGDLVTRELFGDFDLRLEWNISDVGNSGIFYRVAPEGESEGPTYRTGLEMQILDDAMHDDADNGRDRIAGSLYDLHAVARPSPFKPAGQWNAARVVVSDGWVRHYLNGQLVVEVELGSEDWERRLAESKFADWPGFGASATGHLGLQDHGDVVRFRNIRVRRFD